jgi:hypothetical protein
MGTQVSLFQFVGRVGNVLSYYLDGKLTSRTIGKVDLEKMRTAPQYEETRKNQSEFAIASKGGQLFRQGLMHLTKGYTNHTYPTAVIQILLKTLRSDETQPKGKKQLKNGLKNAPAQLAFSKLNIFHKYDNEFYKDILVKKTPDQKAWRLNRQILFGKKVKGNEMTVKIGYYHIDFEGQVANYEHALSISCHRNDKIEFSDFNLPKPNETGTPWTFVIMQVWREGTIQEVTGMTYMSVLDLMENEATTYDNINELKEELIHKCGREMVDSDKQKWYEADGKGGAKGAKGQDLQNANGSLAEVTHEYRMHRDDMVKFGGHNWDDAIGEMVKRK